MYRVYQVQSGDTIESISKNLGVESQILVDLNSLMKEVTPGQLLVVPNQQTVFMTYTVNKGESAYSIAKKFNTSVDNILKLNGLNKNDYIYPNQELLVPKEGVSVYIVEENETIRDVARKLDVSPVALLGQNEAIYLMPDQLIIYKR